MKKYYLHNGQESIGPFTKEELKEQKIKKYTPVWSEDMNDWKKAGEIDELKIILLSIPPPIYNSQKNEFVKPQKRSFLKYFLIGIFLMAFVVIGSTIISENNTNNQDTNIPADDSIQRQTRNNITSLVQVTTNEYSVNTFGGISNLDVMVTNNTDNTIDQITVAIDYIKKNDGIYKKEYLTFNNIPAYQNKSLSAPNSNRGLSVNLTKQTITASELNLCYDNNTVPATGDPDPYKCN
ncbi:DUF4339 domain-containing protein [Flavobacterium sp.]|uniref:DUF4339 domain-containing protein n=1 Tax=Flavobacterium sp. TaxID=239 RepID=UPI003BCBC63A